MMKPSDEVEVLADRWTERSQSMLFPNQAEVKVDLIMTINLLRQFATFLRAQEKATKPGNGSEQRLKAL